MRLFQERVQNSSKFFLLLPGEEIHLDRSIEHPLFEIVRDTLAVADPLAIFFCCHHDGCRECLGSPMDGRYVCLRKLVVVREIEMSDDLIVVAQVVPQRLVVGYS